jgi:hypothetical protein
MEDQESKIAGSVLHADDFQVGMFITILKNHNKLPSANQDGIVMVNDNSLVGFPIKILAIDFPFLAVEVYDAAYKTFFKTQLDIRTRDFKALTDEYICAILPQKDTQLKMEENLTALLKVYGIDNSGGKDKIKE